MANSFPHVTKQLPTYTQKNTMMMSAATVDTMFLRSWKRFVNLVVGMESPATTEYFRKRFATNFQLRYVPMARPMAVHMASDAPVK